MVRTAGTVCRKESRMRILFNLFTTIEIPDVDEFLPKGEVERQLADFFKSEGVIARGLEITNYCVPAEEQEDD